MKKKILFIYLSLSLGVASKAQYTVLYNFINNSGAIPQYGSLTLSGNVLNGMASAGGAMGYGSIFKINKNGIGYKDIHDFNGTNGSYPEGSLILSGKTLFGMTSEAGSGYGNIFSVDTNGNNFKDLFDFNNTNGATTGGYLTLSGNVLYGMTSAGGTSNVGVIFKMDTNGNSYQVLLNFNGIMGSYGGAGLTLSGKRLFGMKASGGTHNDGTIFSIDTNGNGFKKLLDFDSANGKNPNGSLLIVGNKLYGMTYKGGTDGVGLIFSIDTNGNSYKDMLNFDTANGWGPTGDLIISGGTLFGMTLAGGIGVNGNGNIFRIDTDGSHFVNMFEFNGTDGKYPFGDLTLSGNILYGMTSHGGTSDSGVIFKIDTSAVASVNNIIVGKGAINVYPNPNNGTFTLSLSNVNVACNIEIYNIIGEKVYTEVLPQSQADNAINLIDQPTGVYFYRIIKESGELVGEGKVMVQK